MVTGEMLIGAKAIRGSGGAFKAFDPSSQRHIEPEFGTADLADVDAACTLADAAAGPFRALTPTRRAEFLEAIAANIDANGQAIVDRAMAETGLSRMRLEGELGRTKNQLSLFASVLRDGAYLDARIDEALPERTPPRPDLRLMNIPLGPVVVFAASNFPLAFSVAGGDTASAFAAGCPVIVKGHSAHPGTSELVARAVQKAVADCGLHQGVFSLLFGSGNRIGTALVQDPRIQAVGFTGSRTGGLALVAAAQARPQPIPVYAEMSSINPVILLSRALEERGEAIAKAFAGALTLGAGQFCTNPGLLIAINGPALDNFVAAVMEALADMPASTMLSDGIHLAYCSGITSLENHADVELVAQGQTAAGLVARASLFSTTAAKFRSDYRLRDEVFGASSLLVRCSDLDELRAVLSELEGQLTIAFHAADEDIACASELLPIAEKRAGRILFNGFGTGVEVCDAMVHGGPFPATSDVKTTSVGSLAINRFLRPICYQDVPTSLLPSALQDGNSTGLPLRINGERQ